MEPVSHISHRLDDLDAQRLREMRESPAFAIYLDRLRKARERSRDTCMESDSELHIRRAQGACDAWDVAINMADQIINEIVQEKKRRAV